jgi:hypothetical protein
LAGSSRASDEVDERVVGVSLAKEAVQAQLAIVESISPQHHPLPKRSRPAARRELLNLLKNRQAGPSRTHAQEAGVDTISHFSWGDLRDGHWVFIGQATCGKSETWLAKISEPAPGAWGPWLSCLVAPIPYLAVLHHAEEHYLHHLTYMYRTLVLDRIRLCRYAVEIGPSERALIDAVRAEDVVRP